MSKEKNRDNFGSKVVEAMAKRAAYVCSNPECKCLTIAATKLDDEKFTYIGVAAHITAAANGGPRYDSSLTPRERGAINNGMFLCGSCSIMIDKNNGIDYSVSQLNDWKVEHENWVQENLNKKISEGTQTVINVSSRNQYGGITAGVVNIQHSSNYVAPCLELKQQLSKALDSLKQKYSSQISCITIEVESGNSKRVKVAQDLESVLAIFGGRFEQGTFMGRNPGDPITVLGNRSNIPFFKELQLALSPYIDSFWRYPIAESMRNEELRIYINGEPSFNNHGKVIIE